VVIARRKGDRWWIGGITGGDEPHTVTLDLGSLPATRGGTLFTDGRDDRSFARTSVASGARSVTLHMPGHRGFAGVLTGG